MKTAFIVLHIIISLAVIGIILVQPAKVEGLSSAISGGVTETFFGKNKSRTYESKMQKLTTLVMVLFVITSVALGYYLNK